MAAINSPSKQASSKHPVSSKQPASIEHRVSTQHEQQASSKHPVSDSCPCGRIPQTAALLLAKTSDGPPTIE
nr:hypothetical protein [uncultured Prevotella sp.]